MVPRLLLLITVAQAADDRTAIARELLTLAQSFRSSGGEVSEALRALVARAQRLEQDETQAEMPVKDCVEESFESVTDGSWLAVTWEKPRSGRFVVKQEATKGRFGAWGKQRRLLLQAKVRGRWSGVNGHTNSGDAYDAPIANTFEHTEITGVRLLARTWGDVTSAGRLRVCEWDPTGVPATTTTTTTTTTSTTLLLPEETPRTSQGQIWEDEKEKMLKDIDGNHKRDLRKRLQATFKEIELEASRRVKERRQRRADERERSLYQVEHPGSEEPEEPEDDVWDAPHNGTQQKDAVIIDLTNHTASDEEAERIVEETKILEQQVALIAEQNRILKAEIARMRGELSKQEGPDSSSVEEIRQRVAAIEEASAKIIGAQHFDDLELEDYEGIDLDEDDEDDGTFDLVFPEDEHGT